MSEAPTGANPPPADQPRNPWAGQDSGPVPPVPPGPYAAPPGAYAAPPPAQPIHPPAPPAYQPSQAAYPGQPAYPPGQPAYPPGQPAYPPGQPAYPLAPEPWLGAPNAAGLPPLASWAERVGAYLFDVLFQLPAAVPYIVGMVIMVANAPTTTSTGRVLKAGNSTLTLVGLVIMLVGALGVLALSLYNHVFRQGRTGQTWGKSRMGLRLQHQDTGAIIGAGNTFLRQLLHVLDGAAYVGYLWPLWDPLRQTFADKIMRTVVVKVR